MYRRFALVALVLPLAALTFMLPAASPAVATQLVAHAAIALFRGPGEGFEQTDTVAADSKVNVLWCTGDAIWCLVQAGESKGWAPSASLMSKAANSSSASDATAGGVNGALATSPTVPSGVLGATAGAVNSAEAAATAPASAVRSVAH